MKEQSKLQRRTQYYGEAETRHTAKIFKSSSAAVYWKKKNSLQNLNILYIWMMTTQSTKYVLLFHIYLHNSFEYPLFHWHVDDCSHHQTLDQDQHLGRGRFLFHHGYMEVIVVSVKINQAVMVHHDWSEVSLTEHTGPSEPGVKPWPLGWKTTCSSCWAQRFYQFPRDPVFPAALDPRSVPGPGTGRLGDLNQIWICGLNFKCEINRF